MANTKNLKPFNTITVSEQRVIAQKGGIASGIARREKKKIREVLELLLTMTDHTADMNNQEAICLALVNQAKSGDVQAFKLIRDTIGEKPKDEIENHHILTDSQSIDIKKIKYFNKMLTKK